jgi:serine/threonine protein kinase
VTVAVLTVQINSCYCYYYLTPQQSIISGTPLVASAAVDVWSYGMVLYWLTTGEDYFNDEQHDDILQQLTDPLFAVSLDALDIKSSTAYGCLKDKLLNTNVKARASMDMVMQSHSYFRQGAIPTHHSNLTALSTEQLTAVKDSLAKLDEVQQCSAQQHREVTRLLSDVADKIDSSAATIMASIQQHTGALAALSTEQQQLLTDVLCSSSSGSSNSDAIESMSAAVMSKLDAMSLEQLTVLRTATEQIESSSTECGMSVQQTNAIQRLSEQVCVVMIDTITLYQYCYCMHPLSTTHAMSTLVNKVWMQCIMVVSRI